MRKRSLLSEQPSYYTCVLHRFSILRTVVINWPIFILNFICNMNYALLVIILVVAYICMRQLIVSTYFVKIM